MTWLPDFTAEERAAFVKTHGEAWVRKEEKYIREARAIMDLIDPKPAPPQPPDAEGKLK